MGGPSGGSSSGTQKTVAEPWKEQRPFLLDIFRQAENQFHQPGPGYYPGQTVAGQSPATTQAQQYILGQATNQGQQVGQMGVDSLGRLLNGGLNPHLDAAIAAAQRPLIQQFTDSGGTLSNIRDQFTQAGQFGGTRQGIAEGIAGGRLQHELGDISSQIAFDALKQQQQAQVQALSLLPGIQQSLYAPAYALDAVGQQQRSLDQAQIDAMIDRYNYEQNLEAAKLAQYQQLVQGTFGGTSTATGKSGGEIGRASCRVREQEWCNRGERHT